MHKIKYSVISTIQNLLSVPGIALVRRQCATVDNPVKQHDLETLARRTYASSVQCRLRQGQEDHCEASPRHLYARISSATGQVLLMPAVSPMGLRDPFHIALAPPKIIASHSD